MSTAEFTIDGTPYSDRGFDARDGDSYGLLVADPAADIYKIEFSKIASTFYAPAGVFTPSSGIAVDKSTQVFFDVGSLGNPLVSWSFLIRCVVNDGVRVVRGKPQIVPEWTAERIITVRSAIGQRAILQGETRQYDPLYGYFSEFDRLGAAVADAVAPFSFHRFTSGTPTMVFGQINLLSGTVAGALLPSVVGNDGKTIRIKKKNLGSIILGPDGAETIDGAASLTMAANYFSVTLVANETDSMWHVVD